MANGRKTGGGSRKGVPNKHKASFREEIRAYCASIGVDPHRFMADMIADETEVVVAVADDGRAVTAPAVCKKLKFEAAKELAQYLEPKLKAIEHSGEMTHDMHIEVTLE